MVRKKTICSKTKTGTTTTHIHTTLTIHFKKGPGDWTVSFHPSTRVFKNQNKNNNNTHTQNIVNTFQTKQNISKKDLTSHQPQKLWFVSNKSI